MLTFKQTIDDQALYGRYLALELAAVLDRIELAARHEQTDAADPKLKLLLSAVSELSARGTTDRAERILRLYSDPATKNA